MLLLQPRSSSDCLSLSLSPSHSMTPSERTTAVALASTKWGAQFGGLHVESAYLYCGCGRAVEFLVVRRAKFAHHTTHCRARQPGILVKGVAHSTLPKANNNLLAVITLREEKEVVVVAVASAVMLAASLATIWKELKSPSSNTQHTYT